MSQPVPASQVQVKRACAPPAPDDGARILVDRLWPRGIEKEDLAIDQWRKTLAPSTALRQWFGHDPGRWPDFLQRYESELQAHAEPLEDLRSLALRQKVTLV